MSPESRPLTELVFDVEAEPGAPPADVVAFLYARLGDEAVDHHLRGAASPAGDEAHRARAAAMVDEVLGDLAAGRQVERWIVQVLLSACRDHPDYRVEWDEHPG